MVSKGEKYYFVQVNGHIEDAIYVGTPLQEEMIKLGNHFPTREKAREFRKKLLKKIAQGR